MYKAIIFDLGKVLVHFDFKRSYRKLESLCPHASADIPKLLAPTGLVERFETGLVEPRPFVDELCRTLDLRVEYDEFCEIFNGIFTRYPDPREPAGGAGRAVPPAAALEHQRHPLRDAPPDVSDVAALSPPGALVRSEGDEAAAGDLRGGDRGWRAAGPRSASTRTTLRRMSKGRGSWGSMRFSFESAEQIRAGAAGRGESLGKKRPGVLERRPARSTCRPCRRIRLQEWRS